MNRLFRHFPTSRPLFITALALAASLLAPRADAQFGTAFPGFVTLPDDDFTWIWGDFEERDMRRASDIDARGSESFFRCELKGRLRPGSRLSQSDIRQLEQQLNSSLAFIQDSANTMNVLDRSFELRWARLDCKRPEATDEDAEKAQERLDKALERAIRDRERRRARESSDDQD